MTRDAARGPGAHPHRRAAIVLVGDADAILPGLEAADIGPMVIERDEDVSV